MNPAVIKLRATWLSLFFVGWLLLPVPLIAAAKFRIGYSAITATMAPLWAGQEKGLFAKYGIDAELIYLAGGGQSRLHSNRSRSKSDSSTSTPVSKRASPAVISSSSGLYTTAIIFRSLAKAGWIARRNSKAKLSPPAVRVPHRNMAYGTPFNLLALRIAITRYFMQAAPMPVSKRYNEVSRTPRLSSPPNGLIAQKLGFKELINLIDMKIPFGYGAIAARESWLRQNRREVLNFFKAYLEALAMLRQDSPVALAVIGKFSRLNDGEVLQESYRTSIPHIPTRPYVNREIIAKALQMSQEERRRAEPEKFYDNSYVKELDDSGFLGTLFGRAER